MTATEVARRFSAVLNRVDAGEEVEITRSGVAIAELRPAPRRRTVSAQRWRELIEAAPPVDDAFASDVAEARASQEPPQGSWPS